MSQPTGKAWLPEQFLNSLSTPEKFQMVSVTLRFIHRYLPGEKECLQQLSVAGSTGLAGDNED